MQADRMRVWAGCALAAMVVLWASPALAGGVGSGASVAGLGSVGGLGGGGALNSITSWVRSNMAMVGTVGIFICGITVFLSQGDFSRLLGMVAGAVGGLALVGWASGATPSFFAAGGLI